MHYTTITVAPYVDYIAAHKSASLAKAWAHDLADGFPLDLATLYRWCKRLAFRLTFLLTMLEKEVLELTPETDLAMLEKLIVQRATIRQHLRAAPSPANTTKATASVLTLHALCQSSLRLVKQLLRTTGKLLPPRRANQGPPLLFLNFFCWQKTGQALLSPLPLPRASKPP